MEASEGRIRKEIDAKVGYLEGKVSGLEAKVDSNQN
jgi:hypothetical protein